MFRQTGSPGLDRANARSARRRRSRLAAAFAALALVAAACGGDDDDDNTTQTTGGVATTNAGSTPGGSASTSSTPDEPNSGGTLRWGVRGTLTRWDPHRASGSTDHYLLPIAYDRLVTYDTTGELKPMLAESWEFSADGLEMTMKLRDDVKFQDGTPFNAEAVKLNIERGKTVPQSNIAPDLLTVTGVRVVDPTTVVFTLSEQNAGLPAALSARAGSMVSPAAINNPDLDLKPVGSGPYRVTEYVPENRIVAEKNPDYWDKTYGGPDRLEIRMLLDPTTRMNALKAGEVDIADIDGTQQADAERGGFEIATKPGLGYHQIYLNHTRSELGNVKVRQAINHAIDREAYVDVVFGGAGEPTVQPLPEGHYAYNDDFPGDYYEYDPAKAKQLLAEAGLPNGFELQMLVPNQPIYQLAGPLLQQMLGDAGIKVNLQVEDPANLFKIMFLDKAGDSLIAIATGRPDPQQELDNAHGAKSNNNPGGGTSARFAELSAVAKAADPEDRPEALQAMAGEAVEQAFSARIAHLFVVRAHTDKVKGYDMLPLAEMTLRNMSVED